MSGIKTDKRDNFPDRAIDTGGGANIEGTVRVTGGDFVGRDKIIQNIDTFVQRAMSAAEKAEQRRAFEDQRLAQGVSKFVQRLQDRVQATGDKDQGSPYKGLLEYRLRDAGSFFGRESAIGAFVERLQRGPLTVLHAESGAGKTSLLKAGITPRLITAGHLPVYLRPYNVDPALALKNAFLFDLSDLPDLADAPLHDFVRRVNGVLGRETVLCVFIDQFEEFFTQLDPEIQTAFVDALARCVEDDSLNARWVLSLRAEFFSNLATFQPRIHAPFENQLRLERLKRGEAREAIVEPARQRGVSFEPDLVDVLLSELGKGGVAPPQVQIVCSALYGALEGPVITQALYKKLGSVSGMLRDHLKRVLDRDIPAGQRTAARQLVESLVTSDGSRDLRSRDDLAAELTPLGVDEATLDVLLDRLLDSRLLRLEEKKDGGQVVQAYELAHDYLVAKIALDPETRARKAAQELLRQEWRAFQHHRTLLSAEKLDIIQPQAEQLGLSVDELDLLFRSTLKRGRASDVWREYAVRQQMTGSLARRWAGELESEDTADMAAALLVALSDAEAVACLSRLIDDRKPAGQDTPLRRPSRVQRRALAALAQIACPEAEAHLRQWTPEGFCFVPAGRFEMGSDERPDEQPKRSVRLPAFWIAHLPVTVGDWWRFVQAGACAQPRYWVNINGAEMAPRPAPAGWGVRHAEQDYPVSHVTWFEALAYAFWLADTSGLPVSLPTEAEWEKAAGWDEDAGRMRVYPWGDSADASRCNVQESQLGDVTPVKAYQSRGASPCDALDMAGNVLEWTHTQYRTYPYNPDDGREAIKGEAHRVLRGGAYNRSIEDARCARRHPLDPVISLSNTGCRVCLRLALLTPEQGHQRAANAQIPG
jgi:formylglycine-generating enzyme required for sulfatase activity